MQNCPVVFSSTVTLYLYAKDANVAWKCPQMVFQHVPKCVYTFFWGEGQ